MLLFVRQAILDCCSNVVKEVVVQCFRYADEELGVDALFGKDAIYVRAVTHNFACEPCYAPLLAC